MSMRSARRAAYLCAILAFLFFNPADARAANACSGRSPGEAESLLFEVIRTGNPPPVSWWRECNNPSFDAWTNNGSQNLPVVAAAIGMFINNGYDDIMPAAHTSTPNLQVRYVDWWKDYLEAQMGVDMVRTVPPGQTATSLPGKLRYFHGRESFSNTYDAPVVTTVAAIHYWARHRNNGSPDAAIIEDLARRYLRATWAVYGFAAGKATTTKHRMGYKVVGGQLTTTQERTPTPSTQSGEPSTSDIYNPNAPYKTDGRTLWFNGNFLALAGQRSHLGHWVWDDRFPLFIRAIQTQPSGYLHTENPPQSNILNHLQGLWSSPSWNLYGLSLDDRNRLNALIQNGTDPSAFLPWLTGVRTNVTFRILGWANGYRASLLEACDNGNTQCIYGVTYDPATKLATFLYTWTNARSSTQGWARLEPTLIRAYHPAVTKVDAQGVTRTVHPEMEAYVNLEATGSPVFHLVLSQNSNPYLDGTPPSSYPPIRPPRDDWPLNF